MEGANGTQTSSRKKKAGGERTKWKMEQLFLPFFVFWSRRERKIDGDVPSWGKGCQLKQDGVCSNQNLHMLQIRVWKRYRINFWTRLFCRLPFYTLGPPPPAPNIHLTCESDGWFSNWYLSPWTRPASSKMNFEVFPPLIRVVIENSFPLLWLGLVRPIRKVGFFMLAARLYIAIGTRVPCFKELVQSLKVWRKSMLATI